MLMGEDEDEDFEQDFEEEEEEYEENSSPEEKKRSSSVKKASFSENQEIPGEDGEDCACDPSCVCETPPVSPVKPVEEAPPESEEVTSVGNAFQLDEFMRAKAFFLNTSTKSGISLYDHLGDVIRKLLDERAPENPVDYLEEVSMNVKRYRYQGGKDVLQDVFYISEPVLNDAKFLTENWKKYSKWSEEKKEVDGEGGYVGGSFQNLLRLQYYLEQVSIGLPREEMFRLALAIKELTATKPFIGRARLWGKIFGSLKNYYVVEAELKSNGSGDADLWQPQEEETPDEPPANDSAMNPSDEKVPGAQSTLERAGNVVLDMEFLSAYSKTSGLPADKQALLLPKPKTIGVSNTQEMFGEDGPPPAKPIQFEDADAVADISKWQGYQEELMTKFPGATGDEEVMEIPPEADGKGVNRRVFYVCNDLGSEWILLPTVTPKQLNGSREIRWSLTGDLNSKIRTYPIYPGQEGHFLKALLARAAAGSLVSPKGFYKSGQFGGEYDGEDDEDEDEEEDSNAPGEDKVFPMKKYAPTMSALTDPKLDSWVHHASYILPQGRNTWHNTAGPKPSKKRNEEYSEDESEDDETEYEGEGEGEQETTERETGPQLFSPLSNDSYRDGRSPWTLITSSSVFTEFQVASVRSNVWPGSAVICTNKGKVDNIYVGDGLKFQDRCYAPPMAVPPVPEYQFGPEVDECPDPSVEEEQKWLNRLELNQIADIEAKFVDNEDEETYDDNDDEESDEYY